MSIPVLLHEHNRLISGKSEIKELKSEVELLSEMTKKSGSIKTMSSVEQSIAKSILYRILFQIGYILWVVLGLMSFNWWIFAIILIMSRFTKKTALAVRLDAFITICLVVFAILNTSIYKIDAIFYIKTWFHLF